MAHTKYLVAVDGKFLNCSPHPQLLSNFSKKIKIYEL
jgi:hypothetical protein